MILGKKYCLKYSPEIGSITIKESDEVELLEITIDKALNFKKHIENFANDNTLFSHGSNLTLILSIFFIDSKLTH